MTVDGRQAVRRGVRLAGAGALGFGLTVLGFVAYCAFTLPIGGALQQPEAPAALALEDASGAVFASRGVIRGERLSKDTVPPTLAHAVVAIEDRRFYHHVGIDPRAVLRAAWRDLAAGGAPRQGGSTITQQLARLMFLSPERSLRRKVQEALLALWLDARLGKDEVLARYLNTAYFGAGAYGADAAARRYFGRSAADLDLAQAAMLAGLIRAPSHLAPTRNIEGARRRAELVLQAMQDAGYIDDAQAAEARAHPANLAVPPEVAPGRGYFADMVEGDMRSLLGGTAADLAVRTTLDPVLQDIAERTVEHWLDRAGAARHVSQAAVVMLAHDGAILALVGGRDYTASQFDRAVSAHRQAGSLFKLFVYLAAFKAGLAPGMVAVDQPIRIGDWEPHNFEAGFRGPMTLRDAFAQSVNTVAVQLSEQVGRDKVIQAARSLGVQSDLPAVPSLALGSADVTLLEMTRAYAAVAADAGAVDSYAVRAVCARDRLLYRRPPAAVRAPDWNRQALLDVMMDAVADGTGRAARLPRPAAGKTGTTQDYRDAWFIGFTADAVAGVWVGNDDGTAMDGVTGGELPARIWHDLMVAADAAKSRGTPAPATPCGTVGR